MGNKPTGDDVAIAICPKCKKAIYLSRDDFRVIQENFPAISTVDQVIVSSQSCNVPMIFVPLAKVQA